jgi:hypothetical protein
MMSVLWSARGCVQCNKALLSLFLKSRKEYVVSVWKVCIYDCYHLELHYVASFCAWTWEKDGKVPGRILLQGLALLALFVCFCAEDILL